MVTDEDILAKHGPSIWEALLAFSNDPSYLTSMVEAANQLDAKRRSCDVRVAAVAA